MASFQRILVGYLDTEQGREALELGRVLARATGAELIVASSGKDEDLAHLARGYRSDLIVLGPTRRGPLSRVVPGATVERLLGEAPCAIAVAPAGFAARARGSSSWQSLDGEEDAGIRVVGVGYDASDAAEEALRTAVQIAIANGAALRVYTVAPRHALPVAENGSGHAAATATETEHLRAALHEAVSDLPAEARALPVFLRGDPAAELIKASEEGVDLLVLGSRSGGPLRRLLQQSVTSDVMLRAPCPLLISPTGVTAPQPVDTRSGGFR